MDERVWATAKKHEAKKQKLGFDIRKKDFSESISSPIDHILSLQRTIGNQAVQRLFKSGVIQTKLKIGHPNDIYEQEADRVADEVMRMSEPGVQRQVEPEEEMLQAKLLVNQITPLVQRQVEPEEEEEEPIQAKLADGGQVQRQEEEPGEEEEILQTKENPGQTPEIASDLESRIKSLRGSGQPLPKSVGAFFEPRFGYDFRNIRIHTDSRAADTARAFTVGRDVVSGAGQYVPKSSESSQLLAHELTHVLQQNSNLKAIPIVQKRPEKVGVQYVELDLEVRCTEVVEAYSEYLYSKILARLARERPWPSHFDRETEARNLMFEIIDLHQEVPIEPKKTYRYKLELWLPAEGELHSLKATLILPMLPTTVHEPIEIEMPRAAGKRKQSKKPAVVKGARAPLSPKRVPERAKKALEEVDDSLAKLDRILEWGERLTANSDYAKRLKDLREELSRVHEPLSKALKVERTATMSAQLIYAIKQAAKQDPGSPQAVEAVVGLAEPAGELFQAVSEWAPPGVSHFLRALGEAGKAFPGFVKGIKEKMRPTTERRRPERGYVLP